MKRILFLVIVVIVIYSGLSLLGTSFLGLLPKRNDTSDLQASIEILQSFTETIAIIVAGYWTYDRLIKTREDHPYLEIQHRMEHYNLEKGLIYLSVFVTVTNKGKTKLDLSDGIINIRQISPLAKNIRELLEESKVSLGEDAIRLGKVEKLFIDSGQRLGWITLGSRKWNQVRRNIKELEPGQTREIQFDFILIGDDEVKVIEAITYFGYESEKSSWEHATIYSLESGKKKSQ